MVVVVAALGLPAAALVVVAAARPLLSDTSTAAIAAAAPSTFVALGRSDAKPLAKRSASATANCCRAGVRLDAAFSPSADSTSSTRVSSSSLSGSKGGVRSTHAPSDVAFHQWRSATKEVADAAPALTLSSTRKPLTTVHPSSSESESALENEWSACNGTFAAVADLRAATDGGAARSTARHRTPFSCDLLTNCLSTADSLKTFGHPRGKHVGSESADQSATRPFASVATRSSPCESQ